jgi:hypothetical protein
MAGPAYWQAFHGTKVLNIGNSVAAAKADVFQKKI